MHAVLPPAPHSRAPLSWGGPTCFLHVHLSPAAGPRCAFWVLDVLTSRCQAGRLHPTCRAPSRLSGRSRRGERWRPSPGPAGLSRDTQRGRACPRTSYICAPHEMASSSEQGRDPALLCSVRPRLSRPAAVHGRAHAVPGAMAAPRRAGQGLQEQRPRGSRERLPGEGAGVSRAADACGAETALTRGAAPEAARGEHRSWGRGRGAFAGKLMVLQVAVAAGRVERGLPAGWERGTREEKWGTCLGAGTSHRASPVGTGPRGAPALRAPPSPGIGGSLPAPGAGRHPAPPESRGVGGHRSPPVSSCR